MPSMHPSNLHDRTKQYPGIVFRASLLHFQIFLFSRQNGDPWTCPFCRAFEQLETKLLWHCSCSKPPTTHQAAPNVDKAQQGRLKLAAIYSETMAWSSTIASDRLCGFDVWWRWILEIYGKYPKELRNPRNVGKLSACANSGYQALFLLPLESLGTRL